MKEFEREPVPDHACRVRKVTLASGETIELIAFEDLALPESELHVCPQCAGDLVYPVAWDEADGASRKVSLRCPSCEWSTIDVFEEAAIQRFVETLDRGTEALISGLRQLIRVNMQEDIERFARAIAAGHVAPEDFG